MAGRAEDSVTSAATSNATTRAGSLLLLVAAIAVGAYLRFDGLGKPSYWLDEILHQQLTEDAMRQPLWRWITGFSAEHGPLYYLTQLTTHHAHSEFAGRLPAALLGIATIALVGLAARSLKDIGWLAAPASAAFIALSPLHVYYSREARAYALLMFLTAALIAALLRAKTAVAPSIVLVAILYTTAAAAPLLGAAFVVAVIAAFLNDDRTRRRFATIAIVSAATLACMPLLYASRPVEDASWPGFPDVDGQFVFGIVRAFSVTALDAPIAGTAAILMFVAVLAGAVAVMARDRTSGAILIGMTALPLAFSLAALRFLDHFYTVRYVTPAVVGFTLLAGVGVAAAAERTARFFRSPESVALLLALAIVGAFATQTWPAARHEPFQKLDWRGIAKALRAHVRPGDVILAAEPWSEVSLRYYLGEIAGVKLIHMKGWGIAEIVAHQSPAAWLVTAGASADPSVRQWMCRYPLLLSSPLEGFRLHYAPSAQHFLRSRSGPAEQHAASAALGDRGFTITADDELLFGSGWADAEGDFRWAIGRRATLIFPRHERRTRVIRFHALPLDDPALPPQNVRISLNGHAIGAVTLAPRWSDTSVVAVAIFWNDGLNTLTFDFDRANAPASNDPSSADRRELAAAFRRISIDDAGFDSSAIRSDRPLVPSMRLATDELLLPGARKTNTRYPAAQLRRDSVEALLGRLGIDPVTGWTKLARGEVRFEDVVETIAFGSDCEDDAAFLRRAFANLLERKPNEIEQRDLLQRLRNGATREHVISRITKAGDFKRN